MPPPAEGFASRLLLVPALRSQPDRRLVALVREGYEAAFEEIVRRYGRQLGRYAASIVGGRAEDVLQDAFSKSLPALCRDEAEIDLRPWLFRIVRNTALNDLRDNPPSPELLAEALAGGVDPHRELERREELAGLIRRLHALPPRQRAAIVMRELEGLGHAEIAAALGLSGGAARQAIHRARQALRDGVGMAVPLPLLKTLLAWAGPGAAQTTAGLGGAAGAGAGGALKAAAATVLVAGAVGAGVAVHGGLRADTAVGPAAAAASTRGAPPAARSTLPAAGGGEAAPRWPRHGTGGSDDPSAVGRSHRPPLASPPPHRVGSDRAGSGDAPTSERGGSSGGERVSGAGAESGPDGHRGGVDEPASHGSDSSGSEESSGIEGQGSSAEESSGGDSGSGDSGGDAGSSSGTGSLEESGSGDGSSGDPGDEGGVEETSSSGSGSGDSRDSGGGDGFSLATRP